MNEAKKNPNMNCLKKKKNIYKTIYVRQLKRGIYFPKTLLKERGNKAVILNIVLSSTLFLVSIFTAKVNLALEIKATSFLSTLPVFLLAPELIFRITAACEEYTHLTSRYDNKLGNLIDYVFHFSKTFYSLLLLCFTSTLTVFYVYKENPLNIWCSCGEMSLVCSLLSILLIGQVLNLKSAPLYDSLSIAVNNGLNYGAGMAHSFFHGYLKIVLPKKGTEEKGIEELLDIYEANQKSLDKIIRTVAGVQNRVYKNSVYKINDKKGRIYVAAEYATPLKTFQNVIESNGQHSDFYRKHKYEIVLQFYLTLQKILNENEDCKHLCELIYFNDKDENGEFYDVGKILLQRLKDIKKNEIVN